MKSWTEIIEENPRVSSIHKKGIKTRNMYNINMVMNSPVSIYCIVWAIKNMLMNLSYKVVVGEDVNKWLYKYYNSSRELKEDMDLEMIINMHGFMYNMLEDLASMEGMSVDSLILSTLERFHNRKEV